MSTNYLSNQAYQVVHHPDFDIEDYYNQFADYRTAIAQLDPSLDLAEISNVLEEWVNGADKSDISWVMATWLLEFEYGKLIIESCLAW